MRRHLILGSLFLLALPVILLPVIVRRPVTPEPPPPPASLFGPYDSLRTDLADYAWPTDASRALTSTFGEYRRTHFHAGIDISTNDQNGYRVFASRDGYVWRIVVNADGYGKILYIRHADGYTTTYAHLQRFAPRIESRTRAEQMLHECYPVRIDCAPGEIPVRKGDLIAYTGDTGTGTSHLHFEIRDENLNAVNPLQCPAFEVDDGRPPVIASVAVISLQPGSNVSGQQGTQILRPRSGTLPSATIEGPVGLAVQARDKSDGSRYSHGVYRYDLVLDGRPGLTVKIDRIPFHESQQIALHFDQGLLKSRRGRFEKLYVDTRNSIPFLRHLTPGSGVLKAEGLREGTHRYSITATDNAGNATTVEGSLLVRHPPDFTSSLRGDVLWLHVDDPAGVARIRLEGRSFADTRWREIMERSRPDSTGGLWQIRLPRNIPELLSVRLQSHSGAISERRFFRTRPHSGGGATLRLTSEIRQDHVMVHVQLSEIPDEPPVLALAEGPHRRDVPLRPLSPQLYAGWFTPLDTLAGTRSLTARARFAGSDCSATAEIQLFPIAPGKSGEYGFDGNRLKIVFDSLSVYSTFLLTVEKSAQGGRTVYTLGPALGVLRDGLIACLQPSGADSSARLYYRSTGQWRLLSGQSIEPNGTLRGRLRRFLGDITVLPDTTAPWVSSLRVRQGRRPTMTFRYGDDRSGVDSQELKTYIDDRFVIPEIDGEHRKVVIETRETLSRGSHRLTIHLKDQLGNGSVTEHTFSVR